MQMWMIVTVDTNIEWPCEETTISFMDETLILRPPNSEAAADVRIQFEYPDSELAAYKTICRFLTRISWHEHLPARARLRLACTAPTRGGKASCDPPLQADFRLPKDLCLPLDSKTLMAMALYREARGVEGTPFEFLGYFKIINVGFDSGKDQIAWINGSISKLTDSRVEKHISELASLHEDIGKYLYQSGRCAVAHAYSERVVDPDNPRDVFRLSADMPVARALAEHLIEHDLGIPWRFSK